MQLLCLNCGGSSMKYQLIRMPEEVLAQGGIEQLFTLKAEFRFQAQGKGEVKEPVPGATFVDGIQYLLKFLRETRLVKEPGDITAVADKLAHGGEFREPTRIDGEDMATLESPYPQALERLPPAVEGIKVCRELLPGLPQYAVFETVFHRTLPPPAYLYGLAYEWYEQYGTRKYGFHGTCHRYVSEEAAKILRRKLEELKIISCHLGSGTSVAAVKYGKSVDTSSGLTPQSGTIMSTRPGDFDPWVFPHDHGPDRPEGGEVSQLTVTRGGLLGVSGLSGDMQDLEKAAEGGHARAKLALDVFCYQVKKYIGAFAVVINGLDV